jgi:hypothetical protein
MCQLDVRYLDLIKMLGAIARSDSLDLIRLDLLARSAR